MLAQLGPNADDESRVALWTSTQVEAEGRAGLEFLTAVLGSSLERESAAAAAALWRLLRGERRQLRGAPISYRSMEREEGEVELREWDPDIWRSRYADRMEMLQGTPGPPRQLELLVEQRLRQALRSPDPITASLAAAAGLPSTPSPPEGTPGARRLETAKTSPAATAKTVSTMIHGTWGWKGDWWRPSGGFHRFVLGGLRPNLYARGARYSWSGFYRESHRVRASSDFREWGEEIAPAGLQTVFGHSYGAEVAARALLAGVPIEEMVLLSAPVTKEVVAAVETGVSVVDVRLRFDPVLALARTRQRLPTLTNVRTVRLNRWSLRHSATHDANVWSEEDIATQAKM